MHLHAGAIVNARSRRGWTYCVDRRGGDIVAYVLIAIAVLFHLVIGVVLQFAVGTAHTKPAEHEQSSRVRKGCIGVIVVTFINLALSVAVVVLLNQASLR